MFIVWFQPRIGPIGKIAGKWKLLFVSKKSLLVKSSISRDVGDMRYVCFFGVFIRSPVCAICLQSDFSLESVQSANLPEKWKLLFVSKKKSSISRDVGDMRYVSFFLVISSSSVCTVCIQSDLSLDMAKMVTFEKTWYFSLSVKKIFSKSLLILEM